VISAAGEPPRTKTCKPLISPETLYSWLSVRAVERFFTIYDRILFLTLFPTG
jgi:hypothetical protein